VIEPKIRCDVCRNLAANGRYIQTWKGTIASVYTKPDEPGPPIELNYEQVCCVKCFTDLLSRVVRDAWQRQL